MTNNAGTSADVADWFGDTREALDEARFTEGVMVKAKRLRRRKIALRILLGVILAVISIPAQDLGMAVAEVAMVQLVEINNQIAADLLAPINSVGGILSGVLLFLRHVYRHMLRT